MDQLLWTTLTGLLAVMAALWLISLKLRDASIVDPFWGAGFVGVAWFAGTSTAALHWRGWLLIALTTVWGLRLSLYLLWRNRGHGEDHRYAAMRRARPQQFWWVSLFTVFLLQGVVLWFVSWPIQVAVYLNSPGPPGVLDVAGIVVWGLGLAFEAIGDWQLARFRSDPANAGRVLDRGLWRWTRHPNYFGDFCVWWGLYLAAAAGGAGWTVGSPLLMSCLLLRVSGVTLLEQTITDRRPDYAAYQARTSSFLPWPPRS